MSFRAYLKVFALYDVCINSLFGRLHSINVSLNCAEVTRDKIGIRASTCSQVSAHAHQQFSYIEKVFID